MFKNIFGKNQEEIEEPVIPVVEKRKQERFSEPLIYNDEKEIEKPVVEKKPVVESAPKKRETYHMSQIISPILGSTESKKDENKKTVHHKKHHSSSSIVSVISPYFGDPIEEEEVVQDVVSQEPVVETEPFKDEPTVADNLRNFAKLVEDEQNELKIIEQRTGEFKLDFSGTNDQQTLSLIDEIEDDMSLDELMSLYEKKFND